MLICLRWQKWNSTVAVAALSGCQAATQSRLLPQDEELSASNTPDFLLKPQPHNEVGGIELKTARNSICLVLCTQDK